MTAILLLLLTLISSGSSLTTEEFQSAAAKILYLKNLICPEQNTLYVYLKSSSDDDDFPSIASALIQATTALTVFLIVDDPQTIRRISFSRTACLVLLSDPGWPQLGYETWDRTPCRTIVVTELAKLRTVANAFSGRQQIPRVVYLVYDDEDGRPYRYYQPYSRKFLYLRGFEGNPFEEAERDLHGMLVSAEVLENKDQFFLEAVLDRVNAVYTDDFNYVHLRVPDTIEDYLEGFNGDIYYADLQRSNSYVLVVPRSGRKPLFSVLFDPFHWTIWVSFASVVVILSVILIFISSEISWRNFSRNVAKLISNALEGPPMDSERFVERLLLGLFMIGSLILVSCYQSLVISFLLNMRFYPELDTEERIYESCCFVDDFGEAVAKDLYHYRKCNLSDVLNMDEFPEGYDFSVESAALGLCLAMPSSVIDRTEMPSVYRVSKLRTHIFPQLAVVRYESVLFEQFCRYSLEFAAGGLINQFENNERHKNMTKTQFIASLTNSISIEDLKLVWITYPIGITISLAFFTAELFLAELFTKKRKYRPTQANVNCLKLAARNKTKKLISHLR